MNKEKNSALFRISALNHVLYIKGTYNFIQVKKKINLKRKTTCDLA